MNCSHACVGLVAMLLWAGVAEGAERKLYKVTDPAGNVTYQDQPPDDASVKVEEKQIDPDTNVVQRQKPVRRTRPVPARRARRGTTGGAPAQDGPQEDARRAVGVLIQQGVIGAPPPPPPPPPTPAEPIPPAPAPTPAPTPTPEPPPPLSPVFSGP